eukprot:gnl/Chilomastix_cuspidata/3380.p2 GENE.gnl/Chilomastix_cuspidata/3380~~gnl/Chilomastix_cuspidata/3380.p2  ORF type:complete len:104 (-),score=3.31 gnl/Chilomastix_cuspidata/3380:133-444(-)
MTSWNRHADVAQYKEGDWSPANIITRGHFRSPKEAMKFAETNNEIKFFVWCRCGTLVLEPNEHRPEYIQMTASEAVFFRDHMWLGSAPGMADVYERQSVRTMR